MTGVVWDNEAMHALLKPYVGTEKTGAGKAYGGRIDWVPDLDEPDSDADGGCATSSSLTFESLFQRSQTKTMYPCQVNSGAVPGIVN